MTPSTKESNTSIAAKMNNLKAKLKKNLQNRHNITTFTPSRASTKSFMYKTFNTNNEICEKDEDFQELQNTENDYKVFINGCFDTSRLDHETRENIICKIKKICDTFELKDETFYSSVLLNDLQIMSDPEMIKEGKFSLHELFDFTKMSNGQDKCQRYETFFEAVA